jgi:hypothetical protein
VDGRVAILDPPIASAAEQSALRVEECGTDGKATLLETTSRLVDGDLKQRIEVVRHRTPSSPSRESVHLDELLKGFA